MFPTHVGMNRRIGQDHIHLFRVPHARGDEPSGRVKKGRNTSVFPTHVGMNRVKVKSTVVAVRVPHARGDEPKSGVRPECADGVFPTHVGMNRNPRAPASILTACPPRTWG